MNGRSPKDFSGDYAFECAVLLLCPLIATRALILCSYLLLLSFVVLVLRERAAHSELGIKVDLPVSCSWTIVFMIATPRKRRSYN